MRLSMPGSGLEHMARRSKSPRQQTHEISIGTCGAPSQRPMSERCHPVVAPERGTRQLLSRELVYLRAGCGLWLGGACSVAVVVSICKDSGAFMLRLESVQAPVRPGTSAGDTVSATSWPLACAQPQLKTRPLESLA